MRCAMCNRDCVWPKDFPVSHYAVCDRCHAEQARTDAKNARIARGGFLLASAAACAIGCALALLTSCTPAAERRAAAAVKSSAYGLELDACVQNGHTYAEYEACAKGVDARYRVRP